MPGGLSLVFLRTRYLSSAAIWELAAEEVVTAMFFVVDQGDN